MKNKSTPGISTEPKALYEFIFQFLPNFSTNAFNNLYHINIDKSPFKHLKLRNIVFIPKKGADLTNPNNFRPISLLETSYKILSKALCKKVTPYLCKILHSDQFGFTQNRHMSTASIGIISTFNHIQSQKLDAQFISFDIQRAYDRTLPEVTNEIIKYIFPNGNFAQVWIDLTKNGFFRAKVGEFFSPFYALKIGSSQGRPDSGILYNFVHHIFISCLSSKLLQNIKLKINKDIIPPGAFADDTWCFFQLKTNSDVKKILDMLQKIEEKIGMKVNVNKTKILIHGQAPPDINLIGEISNNVKHLGVFLSFNTNESSKLTYDELINKLETKCLKQPMRYGFNIFKRRNLCMTLLNSMCYHIFRIYHPNEDQIKQIWNAMSKFLWSNKTANGISHRVKIASKRVELDFFNGGLKILKPENQCIAIWIPSFINMLKHAEQYPLSNLGIILRHKHVPIKSVLSDFGYKTFSKYKKNFQSLYPKSAQPYFKSFETLLLDLEKDKLTLLHTSILTSSWTSNIDNFTKNEMQCLKENNVNTLFSVLESRMLNNENMIILPMIKQDLQFRINNVHLYEKLSKLVELAKENLPSPITMHISKKTKLQKTLFQNSKFNPSIFSFQFKRIHIFNISEENHPSLETRRRDGKYFPDPEIFFMSMKKLFSLPILLKYKSLFFEQFLRVLPSKNKLFKFGLNETNICLHCNQISDSEHALFYCIFPRFLSHTLAIFLDEHFNDKKPVYIFLKENFYLFNIFYEEFQQDEYIQISMLILAAKDRSLKISTDENCLRKWKNSNCLSQAILISQFVCKLLENCSLNNQLIQKYNNFLVEPENTTIFENICNL